jgi:outer membrane protein W
MVWQPAIFPGSDQTNPTQEPTMSFFNRSLICSSLAGLSILASMPAVAQDRSGLYVSAYGGSSSLASTSLTESRTSLSTLTGKGSFGSGSGLGGAFGYRYGNGWAAELAWDYRSLEIKRLGGSPVVRDFASTTAFINGYYRFEKLGIVRPFVGAGLGYVTEMDMDLNRDGSEQEYSRRGGVAVQAIVGGEMELTDQWSVSTDLRWSEMGSGSFQSSNSSGSRHGGASSSSRSVSSPCGKQKLNSAPPSPNSML